MNQIAASNPFASIGTDRIAAGMNAAAQQLAAGIIAQYFNPLGAGPLAYATMPSMFDIGLFGPTGPVQQPWTATLGQEGRGSVDLGDGYTLQLNERNSEITIHNARTGETTRIWGDPHVDFNGQRVFDFWGTTSFTLGNGTKITIETEQFNRNPNEYVSSRVVITNGSQGLVIDGISQNELGDLSITTGHNGHALDAAHRDGYTLHENMAGASWLTELGGEARQRDLDATRVGREYGPGSELPSLGELSQEMTAWLMVGSLAWATVAAAPAMYFAPSDRER